jgi:hypothetical protein
MGISSERIDDIPLIATLLKQMEVVEWGVVVVGAKRAIWTGFGRLIVGIIIGGYWMCGESPIELYN